MYDGPKLGRSRLGAAADTLAFPLRALLLLTESRWGLSSLREERMRVVASVCRGRVLDVGCGPGNLFVREFLGDAQGIGIDVFPYEGVDNVVDDVMRLPFADESFDTVTLIAVGGHIPRKQRTAEFAEFARVLRTGGRLVMTEGEPVTQFLVHQWVHLYEAARGRKDMDSERGMDEDEEFCMPLREIRLYLNTPPLRLVQRRRFMWGLNNVYVAEKAPLPSNATPASP
ncbi:MAG: class I SAM-dependent methyltransferase [Deltaproteobacteria bacterium]|nr:class I SAM-dependent methyltransferase [Deltaproteobacteria bacterium]